MLKLKLLLACFLMPFSVFSWGQQTPSNTLQTKAKTEILANRAYELGYVCSLYTSSFDFFTLSFVLSKYSTYKVEESCDTDYFYKITLASIDAQSQTFARSSRTLNGGAHAYTMDVNLSPVINKFFFIGNLRFSKVGEVRLNLFEAFKKRAWKIANVKDNPYTIFNMESNIHYIWNIGNLVHILIAPNGDRYIMYAFTNEVDRDLRWDNLIGLGSKLNLPTGWSYQNLLLSKTITVNPAPADDHRSVIIFDEFNNFYVKYSP
jgi:hypothetical protein